MARYGGEEFLVWLPETNVHDAERVTAHIRSEIAATPIPLSQDSNQSLYLTVSIGIAVCRPLQFSFADTDDMIPAADEAVYAAKSAGRNRVLVNIAAPTTETSPACA